MKNTNQPLIKMVSILFLMVMFAGQSAIAEENSQPSIRLLGVGTIGGDATDCSGLNHELTPTAGTSSDTIPEGRTFSNDMFGGISAIAWTGTNNIYWMLPDRGPLDGAVDWSCRVQKVRVSVGSNVQPSIQIEPLETIVLRDDRGIPFTGYASAFQRTKTTTQRLDPEGILVGANGNLFVSDEYGPRVIEFSPTGMFVQELKLPNRFLINNPDVSKTTENPKNTFGRATNRGMEGLAISSDGQHLFGLMQSPLLQDAHRPSLIDKPKGLNCRLPTFSADGEFGSEFVYHLENESNKLNEILACGRNQFVVIERDGEAGLDASFKKLMLVSTEGASDVSSVEQLPQTDLPTGIKPVAKRVLIDLLDDRWGLSGAKMPEKIEGLAFGPSLDPDHRLLLVASDNDFVSDQDTFIYAFAVPVSAFKTYDRQARR